MTTEALGLGKPAGWYYLGLANTLKPGQLVTRRFFGHDVVLFRTQSGRLVVSEPYCPHLGAHLGHGGRVEGENVRCPFHGFCFNGDGACVSTPYGSKAPAAARLSVYPSRELHGLMLVWFDELGREPWFEVPDLDMRGWPPLKVYSWDLRSHPQETTENSVDIGHLTVVHGFQNVRTIEPMRLEGPYLTARYGFLRDATLFGKPGKFLDAEFTVHVHGLGYSLVEVDVCGMRTRQLVLATPTEDERIALTIAMSVVLDDPRQLNPVLDWIPRKLATWLSLELGMLAYRHDVSQDFDIWQQKIYVERPKLARGDGPIGPYRRWCKQFYPEHRACQQETAAGAQ